MQKFESVGLETYTFHTEKLLHLSKIIIIYWTAHVAIRKRGKGTFMLQVVVKLEW